MWWNPCGWKWSKEQKPEYYAVYQSEGTERIMRLPCAGKWEVSGRRVVVGIIMVFGRRAGAGGNISNIFSTVTVINPVPSFELRVP